MSRSVKPWRLLAGLMFTAVFLYLAFRKTAWQDVADALASLAVMPLLSALLLLAAGYTVRIVRWWWMLRTFSPDLAARKVAWPFLVSQALNNVLPFRAGDFVRVVAFRRELDASAMRIAGTLVFERVLDLTTLLLMLFIGSATVMVTVIPEQFLAMIRILAAIVLALIVAILVFPAMIRRIALAVAGRMPVRAQERLGTWISEFFDTLARLKSRHLLLRLVALSLVVWLFEAGVFLAVSLAMAVPLAPAGALFTVATGTLATLLPSTPGYVGTFDYFTMLGAMAYGFERGVAAAFALVVHIVLWFPITLAGLVYFVMPAHRLLWYRRGALDPSNTNE